MDFPVESYSFLPGSRAILDLSHRSRLRSMSQQSRPTMSMVFKFGIQDGVFKGGRAWSEIRYFRMIKKQRNKKGRRKSCDNQRKRIYLVYNVFKAWRMQKSRRDVTVGIAVISPHICCLLNTEEGKNNAIYVL